MEKSGLASPNSDVAVVATVLQQQQQHQRPSADLLSSNSSTDGIKMDPSVKSQTVTVVGGDLGNHAVAAANSADMADGHSDACSEDSRHSVSSLDSGKGSTTVPSTSVSPESHPPPTSSSALSMQNPTPPGMLMNNAGAPPLPPPVKFESTLVKKMLTGDLNLNGEETKEAELKCGVGVVSSALPNVANGVANGHTVPAQVPNVVAPHVNTQQHQHPSQTVTQNYVVQEQFLFFFQPMYSVTSGL